jgi:hypothetical protein
LEKNGIAVLTFPFFYSLDKTRRRAAIAEGKVINILPAVIHGNPINDGGALVFNDLGWDFIDYARSKFSSANFLFYSSFVGWHFGGNRTVLVLRK